MQAPRQVPEVQAGGAQKRRLPQVLPAGRRVAPQPACGAPGTDDDVPGGEEETEGGGLIHRLHTGDKACGDGDLIVQVLVRADCSGGDVTGRLPPGPAPGDRQGAGKSGGRVQRVPHQGGYGDYSGGLAAGDRGPSRGQDPGAPGRRHRREGGANGDVGHGLGQAARGFGGELGPVRRAHGQLQEEGPEEDDWLRAGRHRPEDEGGGPAPAAEGVGEEEGDHGTDRAVQGDPDPHRRCLTIEVDLTALEEMAQAGNILNVGSSGDVKFQETARRAGSLRMEAEKEELERRLAQVSKGLEAAKAEESANAMARMTVEEKGKGESEEESGEDHGDDTSGAEGGRKDPKPRAEGSGNPPDAGRRGATSTGGAGSNPERAASSPRRPPSGE